MLVLDVSIKLSVTILACTVCSLQCDVCDVFYCDKCSFVLLACADEPSRKKRKSRWGSESTKTVLPGLPTSLPANMSEEQQKLYICEMGAGLDWEVCVCVLAESYMYMCIE